MKDLLTLIQDYATACASAERRHALAERTTGDAHDTYAAEAAEWDATATVRHAQLHTALDLLTRTTMRAVPDERLPVCTWQKGTVEARAVLPDHSRSVRVRYTPAQAIAAGAALIACAAVADGQTGGTLTPILPVFPAAPSSVASTDAGPITKGQPTP